MTRGTTPTRVERLETTEALEAYSAEWERLRATAGASPFLSPAWLVPWWRTFGPGALHALAIRRGDSLVGLAPLFIREEEGVRRVLLVGTGNTDHLGAVAAREAGAAVADAVARYLSDIAGEWDECDLQQLEPGSPLATLDLPDAPSGETVAGEVCPALLIPEHATGIEDVVPRRFLSKVRYYRRRLEREGAVRIEATDDASVEGAVDALVRLHAARWSARDEPGVLAGERVRRFHRDAARALVEAGLLSSYTLHLDGEPVAAYHGLRDRRHECYYLGGFDPHCERLNVGTVIVGHAIATAIDRGAAIFDFLRGRESYKYRWGATDQPRRRRRIQAPAAIVEDIA